MRLGRTPQPEPDDRSILLPGNEKRSLPTLHVPKAEHEPVTLVEARYYQRRARFPTVR